MAAELDQSGPVRQRLQEFSLLLHPSGRLTGGTAGKAVAKLLTEGLVKEIPSRGSLPIWRRDQDDPRSLRIIKNGLQAIQIEDETPGSAESAKKPPAPSARRNFRRAIERRHGPWLCRRR
jgi:hypothetical protein